MTTANILSEYSISVPDGKSIALVIYCRNNYCGCLYAFFSPLGETELRREEAWRARADVRYVPPTGRSSARLLQYLAEQYPRAMVLKSLCCYDSDAPDVFEANACGYCWSLTPHLDECPALLGEYSDPGFPAAHRAWSYGYKMGCAGRWMASSPGFTAARREFAWATPAAKVTVSWPAENTGAALHCAAPGLSRDFISD